jgi:hypothetical protein
MLSRNEILIRTSMTPESYHHQQVLLILSSSHILPSGQLVQYLPKFKNVNLFSLMLPKENKALCLQSKENGTFDRISCYSGVHGSQKFRTWTHQFANFGIIM